MAKRPTKPVPVYQLRITLREIEPPILRVLQIKGNVSLKTLHVCIQGVMRWTNSHLHEFKIDGKKYRGEGMYDPVEDPEVLDESEYRLGKLVDEKSIFIYEYDFGDCWEHEIWVEKVIPAEEGVSYPICLYGERACPPEDCGGTWGYEELLNVLNDPEHEDHKQFSEWVGKHFDPEKFDIAETNRILGKVRSIYRERRGNWI